MPNTKTIKKEEQFELSNGELVIKCYAGDAHITYFRVYHNLQLIRAGEGQVQVSTMPEKGDTIFIVATINKPSGSSDYATISIDLEDNGASEDWEYSSHEPDYDEVIYEVKINLV
jgi:hypothetical protein